MCLFWTSHCRIACAASCPAAWRPCSWMNGSVDVSDIFYSCFLLGSWEGGVRGAGKGGKDFLLKIPGGGCLPRGWAMGGAGRVFARNLGGGLNSEPIFRQGIRRSTFQWRKRAFQWKAGRDSVKGGLVRISTGKAIQWRGPGHSVNRRTPEIEKLLSKSTSQKSAPINIFLGGPEIPTKMGIHPTRRPLHAPLAYSRRRALEDYSNQAGNQGRLTSARKQLRSYGLALYIYIYMPVTSFGGLFWGSKMSWNSRK